MGSLKRFYEGLSDTRKDLFAQLANDLRTNASEEKMGRLRLFMQQLKSEIEEINRRRKALGEMLDNVVRIREDAARVLEKDPDIELLLFRDYLTALELDLRGEIEALRPDNKLEKKCDVSKRLKLLAIRRGLSDKLMFDVVGAKDQKLPPAIVAQQEAAASAVPVPPCEEIENEDETDAS